MAGGPQVDLLGGELILAGDAAHDPVDDVAGYARRVDVAHADNPVGARGVGGDVEHGADTAGDLHVFRHRLGGVEEHVWSRFDETLVERAGPELVGHECGSAGGDDGVVRVISVG